MAYPAITIMLSSILQYFADECPTCKTPLLEASLASDVDGGTKARTADSVLIFCVKCRNHHGAVNDEKLDKFYKNSKGSLLLLRNPFEKNESRQPFLRECIKMCYKDFINETSLVSIAKTFNQAKTIMTVYEGDDVLQILNQFVLSRKVKVFLKLGEHFCEKLIEDGASHISQLERCYAVNFPRGRIELITSALKRLIFEELPMAKQRLLSAEKELELHQLQYDEARSLEEHLLMLKQTNEENAALREDCKNAASNVKLTEALLTIQHNAYAEKKNAYEGKEKEILSFKSQILQLETQMSEATSNLKVNSAPWQVLVEKVTSKLEYIRKAIALVQDRLNARADLVFISSGNLVTEEEVMKIMCDCVKNLVQECIPQYSRDTKTDTVKDSDDGHSQLMSLVIYLSQSLVADDYNEDDDDDADDDDDDDDVVDEICGRGQVTLFENVPVSYDHYMNNLDMDIYSDDIVDIKSIPYRKVLPLSCSYCNLPMSCKKNDSTSSCFFCFDDESSYQDSVQSILATTATISEVSFPVDDHFSNTRSEVISFPNSSQSSSAILIDVPGLFVDDSKEASELFPLPDPGYEQSCQDPVLIIMPQTSNENLIEVPVLLVDDRESSQSNEPSPQDPTESAQVSNENLVEVPGFLSPNPTAATKEFQSQVSDFESEHLKAGPKPNDFKVSDSVIASVNQSTGYKIVNAVNLKLGSGWILKENEFCASCGAPIMVQHPLSGSPNIFSDSSSCVLCNEVLNCNVVPGEGFNQIDEVAIPVSVKTCKVSVGSTIVNEVGNLMAKGWVVKENDICESCGLPKMSLKEGAALCILCDEFFIQLSKLTNP